MSASIDHAESLVASESSAQALSLALRQVGLAWQYRHARLRLRDAIVHAEAHRAEHRPIPQYRAAPRH